MEPIAWLSAAEALLSEFRAFSSELNRMFFVLRSTWEIDEESWVVRLLAIRIEMVFDYAILHSALGLMSPRCRGGGSRSSARTLRQSTRDVSHHGGSSRADQHVLQSTLTKMCERVVDAGHLCGFAVASDCGVSSDC